MRKALDIFRKGPSAQLEKLTCNIDSDNEIESLLEASYGLDRLKEIDWAV
jgi:hypothetical protein